MNGNTVHPPPSLLGRFASVKRTDNSSSEAHYAGRCRGPNASDQTHVYPEARSPQQQHHSAPHQLQSTLSARNQVVVGMSEHRLST